MKSHIAFKILNFAILFAYVFNQDQPALKVNLNPPEENTKDTISKTFAI